jgi:hypothetical protein
MKIKFALSKLFHITLISWGLPFIINAGIHQPQLQIPYLKTAPVIDVKLNEVAWKKSTELSEFINWSLDTYIKDAVYKRAC